MKTKPKTITQLMKGEESNSFAVRTSQATSSIFFPCRLIPELDLWIGYTKSTAVRKPHISFTTRKASSSLWFKVELNVKRSTPLRQKTHPIVWVACYKPVEELDIWPKEGL